MSHEIVSLRLDQLRLFDEHVLSESLNLLVSKYLHRASFDTSVSRQDDFVGVLLSPDSLIEVNINNKVKWRSIPDLTRQN